MVVSEVWERLRYCRVEGQEQLCGMELYPFLLTSRWVSLESFSTRWVSKDKDCGTDTDKSSGSRSFFSKTETFRPFLDFLLVRYRQK